MKEECRISSLCSPLICCRMQGKRTDHCKVRIEVFNLFLGEKSCIGRIELVKPVSIVHRSIPAWPRPPPPGYCGTFARLFSPGGEAFAKIRGPGICQPWGYSRAFDTRAVSYQNITTHKILLGKKRTDSSVKDKGNACSRLATSRPLGERSEPFLAVRRPIRLQAAVLHHMKSDEGLFWKSRHVLDFKHAFFHCLSSQTYIAKLGSYRRESAFFWLVNQISGSWVWRTSFHIYNSYFHI